MMGKTKIKQHNTSLRLELIEKLTTLVTAGFGLAAALAWNDAIQSLFKTLFPEASNVIAKFIYAIIITVFVVIITTRLARMTAQLKKE